MDEKPSHRQMECAEAVQRKLDAMGLLHPEAYPFSVAVGIVDALSPILTAHMARDAEKVAAFDALEALVKRNGDAAIWCDLMMAPPHWQIEAGAETSLVGQTLSAALLAAGGAKEG